jgi:hypothetical protein
MMVVMMMIIETVQGVDTKAKTGYTVSFEPELCHASASVVRDTHRFCQEDRMIDV